MHGGAHLSTPSLLGAQLARRRRHCQKATEQRVAGRRGVSYTAGKSLWHQAKPTPGAAASPGCHCSHSQSCGESKRRHLSCCRARRRVRRALEERRREPHFEERRREPKSEEVEGARVEGGPYRTPESGRGKQTGCPTGCSEVTLQRRSTAARVRGGNRRESVSRARKRIEAISSDTSQFAVGGPSAPKGGHPRAGSSRPGPGARMGLLARWSCPQQGKARSVSGVSACCVRRAVPTGIGSGDAGQERLRPP